MLKAQNFQVSETEKVNRQAKAISRTLKNTGVSASCWERGSWGFSRGSWSQHARTFRFNSTCKDVLIIVIIFLCLVLTLNKSHSWKKKKNHWKLTLASDIPGTSQHKQYITLYSKHQCPIKGEPFEEFHMVCKSLITVAFLKVKVRSFSNVYVNTNAHTFK